MGEPAAEKNHLLLYHQAKFCEFGSFLRDGVKKSKWKFKMAFAMKGGEGGLEGVSSATYLF